jgi:hypothetical protein
MYRQNARIKIIVAVIIVSCLSLVGACARTENNTNEHAIKQQLEKFVKAEYEGVVDIRNDKDIVTFHADYQMLISANPYGAAIYSAGDPLMIVGSYHIESVKVYDDFAFATVIFRRLAHTQGAGLPGRDIIPDLMERDSVEYFLRKKANVWTVYDPSLPRISKKALIEYYKREMDQMAKAAKDERTGKEQKQVYKKMEESLGIVNKLRD